MVNNCFKEKSNLVKFLICLLVILIIVLVALFINLVIRKDDHACHSESCIKASAEIIRYIDQSIDPCEDFHAFVCGNFMKNMKELPPPEPEEELNLMISNTVFVNDTKPFTMQKLFYQACINLGAINMDEDETMLFNFDSLGDWPVLKGAGWNGTFFDWVEVVKKSRQIGLKIDWFLEFTVHQDYNTDTNLLKISIPSSLRRISDLEKHQRKNLLTQIAEIMGAPKYLAHYETAKTIEFEDELAALVETHINKNMFRLPNGKFTVNELQLLWPNIEWLELLNNVTNNKMDSNSYVMFNVLDYIRELEKLILGTPKRIVADYMMWKIIEEYWQYLSLPIREKFEKYNQEVFNQLPQFDRQKFCLEESKKQFPLVAESVYVRRHVTEQKRQLVRDMLYTIKHHYIKLLENASGMNRETRRRGLTRLENMKFLIGGPEVIFDQFRFAENLGLYGFGFKSMNVIDMLNERRNRFYDNYFSVINRGITNNTIRFYEKVINITAFSVINQNTIVIPAALMRDSFYNPNVPNYLNYGTLGKVLAHEIFDHIFERQKVKLIHEGNDHNSWLDSDVFDQPVKCLVKEATFFHNSELRQPLKLRKYLGDFMATDVAYESYDNWLRMLSDEFVLPGLKFTPHQLFWIQMSRFSCNKIFTRHHRDNSRFKIVAPLRNSRNFARDFYCSEGSKMNPKRKCRIL